MMEFSLPNRTHLRNKLKLALTIHNDNFTMTRSSFGAASSSSSQVVHAEDSDVGNDQVTLSMLEFKDGAEISQDSSLIFPFA